MSFGLQLCYNILYWSLKDTFIFVVYFLMFLFTAIYNPQSNEALKPGQRLKVIVSHVQSPAHFFIQLDTQSGKLEAMMNSMYEQISSLPEDEGLVSNPEVGGLYAALFDDESWYRVCVKSVGPDSTLQVSKNYSYFCRHFLQ